LHHYEFDWDEETARINERRYGVGFDEAKSCFLDVFAIESFDVDRSLDEDRFVIIGKSDKSVRASDDPLDREIDFSKARPNPYWLGVVDRACVRLIDKDLADLFPDNDSVNAALRTIADAARRSKVSARRAAVAKNRLAKSRR
jgi:hypothetical protein